MKESKPLVVRYCPYKPLPYHRSVQQKALHKPVRKLLKTPNPCPGPTSITEKKTEQSSYTSDLVTQTLQAISSLYPADQNTRVHWDLPSSKQPPVSSSHPLHNVTLVTTPADSPDDLSDVLEEVLDLWAALNKSNPDLGAPPSCHGILNEE
ncbi:uncharacterized protein LOC134813090 [Bolinopsis microptera]|uniref:uncharacterized protein LOC134813090 n=1 Tax=Bolinopsis microptera TaxID=2820187 RepID=UPI003078BFB1